MMFILSDNEECFVFNMLKYNYAYDDLIILGNNKIAKFQNMFLKLCLSLEKSVNLCLSLEKSI